MDYDPLRPRWRTGLGSVLIAQVLLMPIVFFWFIGSTPYPVSRVGMTAEAGKLQVLNAVCPGEQLLEMTLRSIDLDRDSSTVLWSVTGETPLPERTVLGDAMPGMVTRTPLTSDINPVDQLSLRVVTSDVEGLEFSLDFTLTEVPGTGVLSFNGSFDTVDAYRADVLADTPCDDPAGAVAAWRKFVRFAIGQLVAVAAGVALLISTLRFPPPREFTMHDEPQLHS